MGMCKVVKTGEGRVVIVHQLDMGGKPYAENVIVEVQEGVDPSRISYLLSQDGKIGVLSLSFSPYDESQLGDLKFPEV